MTTPAAKLARVQAWLGSTTVGIYSGIETVSWSIADFTIMRDRYKRLGIDYAVVKCGEGGPWYSFAVAILQQLFLDAGIGFAPYWFCRPENIHTDILNCARLANLCGGIILDCEEQYRNQSAALKALVDGIREIAPNAAIIVTGYGDPIYAFGYSWDFASIANADAYQPQWYIGYWTPYYQHGWRAALDWGDQQCAQAFTHFGLGTDFPIQPAMNIENVTLADMTPMAQFLMQWKASLMVWEYQDASDAAIQALIAGAKATHPAPIVPPPAIDPVPSPSKNVWVVRPGDTLSAIGEAVHVSFQAIADLNHIPNVNLITVGERLLLPNNAEMPPTPPPVAHPARFVNYTVAIGDTLSALAARFGTPGGYMTIAHMNHIANPNLIFPGQILVIQTTR